jgi:hypothetical protein
MTASYARMRLRQILPDRRLDSVILWAAGLD